MTNRLGRETSPYLLQHAHNPVDWYPWGDEALERAQAEGRPILLSIGYSACHWCHVMERESFEDAATAEQMNRDFVCIKVDREERPELDAIYMAAVQRLTGSGGWPMTVFLTPTRRPFHGGTYFPPEPRHGLPSFRQVMGAVAAAWRDRREELEAASERLTEAIAVPVATTPGEVTERLLDEASEGLLLEHDPRHGGFGGAPKFPQAMALDFLVRRWRHTGDARLLAVVSTSLGAMARGGIHDHLGGGFSRYSTDAEWLAPHFEKMLYDQALLARAYLHHHRATGDEASRRTAEGIIDYVLRDMTSPEGGFFAAEDADSEGVEGRFYTWTAAQAREASEDDFEVMSAVFDITERGNWEGTNILRLVADPPSVADRLGIPLLDCLAAIERGKAALLEARERRVRPARDDKVLTSWNGLMLAAVAEAAAVLDRPDYLAAAQRNAALLLDGWTDGSPPHSRAVTETSGATPGLLEDHAFLAAGLLQLYQADFDPRWYVAACDLADRMMARFASPDSDLLYSTAEGRTDLLHRPVDFDDNAVPSANSVAAEVLVELWMLSGVDRYRAVADRILARLARPMAASPLFFGRLLSVVDLRLADALQVAIAGDLTSPGVRALLGEVRSSYLPSSVVAAGPATPGGPELLRGRTAGPDGAAYVCRGFACDLPASTPEALRSQLSAGRERGGQDTFDGRQPV